MSADDAQRHQLEKTIAWATKIREYLQPLIDAHGHRVHFRPSSTGFSMVGLLHDRPQRGKSGLRDPKHTRDNFETLFAAHCQPADHGRRTGEKALQSFLIRESYSNGRALAPINVASRATNDPVELLFITDEISLPVDDGKMVCDLLALRRDGGRSTPVLLELKDARMFTRLVEQVESYAALIDAHADLFAKLFGALLGETITFDAPAEKWIVWPAAADGPDAHEAKLREKDIRVVTYTEPAEGRYALRVGDR